MNVIPPVISDSPSLNNTIIDFVWLSPVHLMIVNSKPSSSECHLYVVQPSKCDGIKYLQRFSVGSLISKGRNSETSNKRISLRQPSDIVKLDLAKRKEENSTLILLFAIKSDGEIFFMEIDQNQLRNK